MDDNEGRGVYDPQPKPHPKDNIAFISRLMTDSRYGVLTQAFILEALGRYAKLVASTKPEEMENAMISGELWRRIGEEIHTKIEEYLK